MQSHRYSFAHSGKSYRVDGTYGRGPGQTFVVTDLVPGATRMMGTTGSGPHGLKILFYASVATEDELRLELEKKFPGLSDFKKG